MIVDTGLTNSDPIGDVLIGESREAPLAQHRFGEVEDSVSSARRRLMTGHYLTTGRLSRYRIRFV